MTIIEWCDCEACAGNGFVADPDDPCDGTIEYDPCEECDGTGQVLA